MPLTCSVSARVFVTIVSSRTQFFQFPDLRSIIYRATASATRSGAHMVVNTASETSVGRLICLIRNYRPLSCPTPPLPFGLMTGTLPVSAATRSGRFGTSFRRRGRYYHRYRLNRSSARRAPPGELSLCDDHESVTMSLRPQRPPERKRSAENLRFNSTACARRRRSPDSNG